MREFIDKTSEKAGTPINRENMMAIQGFESVSTTINPDNIVERNATGEVLTTTFNADGSITERFSGEKQITKVTTFNGIVITEEIR